MRLQRNTIDRAEVAKGRIGPSQENSKILVYMKTSHLSNFQLLTHVNEFKLHKKCDNNSDIITICQ